MKRSTRNALLVLGAALTFGLVPVIYRKLHPRPTRRPRLSTVLTEDTELRNWRAA